MTPRRPLQRELRGGLLDPVTDRRRPGPEHRAALKRLGLLTRDAREKESKKYGLKKARKAPQYSKR